MWTTENMPDQSGKTIIVTGANIGIGYETTLALYKAGAHVIMACRSLEKAETAAEVVKQEKGSGSLEIASLDLASLSSVQEFVKGFAEKHQLLDCLINNAGVMMPPASKTKEGIELQFGVNFIGHFALTGLLFPILSKTEGARIITLSSGAYRSGTINFDNLRIEQDYEPFREYAQSKLADLIFSIELQRRIEKTGAQVVSVAAQPGANNTNLARYMKKEDYDEAVKRTGPLMEPWQGALPTLFAATSPETTAGQLYEPHEGGYRGYPTQADIQENALDEKVAEMLWNFAEQETGVKYPSISDE